MKWLVVALGAIVAVFVYAPTAHAESLRIQPLKHEATLQGEQPQKGYIDVTNTSATTVRTRLYVQEFRQIDDDGSLEFVANDQYSEAISLDYDTVNIEPEQTLRLYFTVTPNILPKGDVFAVIFAENVPEQTDGLQAVVRVGTLLLLTNQVTGERRAAIEALDFPLLQLGGGLDGAVKVSNVAKKGSASGFYPKMTFATVPFGPKFERTGPLVMAGRTRSMEVYEPMNLAGIYRVTVEVAGAKESRYVAMVTGYWRWVLPLVLLVGGAGVYGYVYVRAKRTAS